MAYAWQLESDAVRRGSGKDRRYRAAVVGDDSVRCPIVDVLAE